MLDKIKKFLVQAPLEKHLLYALLLGFFFRFLAAVCVYGPQALDDYLHGVTASVHFYLFNEHGLPELRSPLLIWILGGWLKLLSIFFGELSPIWQVRSMLLLLGTASLSGIYGTYLYVRNYHTPLFGPLALYLVALYALMPFVSTRAFGESFSLCFVLLAFGLIFDERSQNSFWKLFFGFLVLGFATLLRFHIGLIYVLFFLWILFEKKWKTFFPYFIAGFITLFAEIAIDAFDGRAFMATLRAYLFENQDTTKYGVQPFHATWVTWLGMMMFPFSLAFGKSWIQTVKNHKWLFGMTFVFVLIHSLVPHKEERFLYPILGLSLILLSAAWGDAWGRNLWVKSISVFLIVLHGIAVIIVSSTNTQTGEVGPAAHISSYSKNVLYLDYGSIMGAGRFRLAFIPREKDLMTMGESLTQAQDPTPLIQQSKADRNIDGYALLTSQESILPLLQEKAAQIERELQTKCSAWVKETSFLDEWIYKMNPKSNQRRRPTWWQYCQFHEVGTSAPLRK